MKLWMKENVGPRAILEDLLTNVPQLRGIVKDLPAVLHNLAAFLENAAKVDMKPDE